MQHRLRRAGHRDVHYSTGDGHRVEVNGRHCDVADNYELVAAPKAVGQAIIGQAAQGTTSGAFEVLLPAAGDRIYFAETPVQVLALLRLTFGIHPDRVQEETNYLARAVQAGRCHELRFRGWFGHVGQLAYVGMARLRPCLPWGC